jgi:T5SS/PEP-CTERM-associated repeat protein
MKKSRKNSVIAAVTVLWLAGMSAFGQDTVFTDSSGDHLWSNPVNWNNGLPVSTSAVAQIWSGSEDLILNSDAGTVASFINGNNSTSTFTIASSGSLTTSTRFDVGDSGGTGVGVLNVNGGSLNVGADFQFGRYGDRAGIVTLNSGSITVAGQTQIGGWNAGTGDLTVNGGTFTASNRLRVGINGSGTLTVNDGLLEMPEEWGPGTLEIGNSGGDGLFILNGGTVSIDGFSMDTAAAGSARAEINGGLLQINNQWGDTFNIDNDDAEFFIGNGVVTRAGNSITVFTDAIEAGYITWDSSNAAMLTETWDVSYTNGTGGVLYVDYNDANSNATTMWAVIPEPATLGLVAAMGGIMLMVRRAFML